MEQTFARELLDFLDASPSCYHAAANVAVALEQAGYRHLMEFEPWHLERGGAYYVMRGDSTVAAFRIPQGRSGAFCWRRGTATPRPSRSGRRRSPPPPATACG